MVANPERRDRLTDAGLAVLADGGARALTHRAVDRAAGVPTGTTANYFPSRDELLAALGARVFDRLAPDPDRLAELAGRRPDLELFTDYMHDIVARVTADPDLIVALFELRLEARRRPPLAAELTRTLRRNYETDVEFAATAGFPVGPVDIALMHYALDGLLLDLLTSSIDAGVPSADAVRALTHRLVGGAWRTGGDHVPEGTADRGRHVRSP